MKASARTMWRRLALERAVNTALARARAVVLAGPRQSGKTTLARAFLEPSSPRWFDLENPLHAGRLAEPMATLAPLQGLVVKDEVQRRPELFPVLRVLIDRSNASGRFLLLGSASPALLRQAGESLLGRAETLEQVLAHPRCGASWEGYALEQVLRLARPDESCSGPLTRARSSTC